MKRDLLAAGQLRNAPARLRAVESSVEAELRRQNDELAALHDMAVGLIEGLELSAVLEAIVGRAGQLIGTPHGYLYLLEPDGEEIVVRVATGAFVEHIGYRLRRGEGLAGLVWASGRADTVESYRAWDRRVPDLDSKQIGALTGVPLLSEGQVVGVIGLAYMDDTRTFGSAELEVLERFARLASLALRNARLYDAAKRELAERERTEEELQEAIAHLRRSELELQLSREEMIRRLSYAAEFRDATTGSHIERMARFCFVLAHRLGLEEDRCELIRIASPLHDVGKIGIPDRVLLKPGPLTPEERREVQRHPEIGHAILAGSGSPLLELAATIALTHHERFDGSGYPRGLRGEAIPLEGRIASVADVFDALTSDRPYRPAFPPEVAVAMLVEGRGTQFDPLVLDLFLDSVDDLLRIRGGEPLEVAPVSAVPRGTEPAGKLQPAGEIPAAALAAACREAEHALVVAADDRTAIETALERLCTAVGPELLASVYIRDRGRLWIVSQYGYGEVRDGFGLDQGIVGRVVRSGRAAYLADVSADPDFIAAVTDIRSELSIPLGGRAPAAGILNLETKFLSLPPEALELVEPLARRLMSRLEGVRPELDSDLPALARLFVEGSSLRSVEAIAEFASRALGRLLGLETSQIHLLGARGGYKLASFWRLPDSSLEPLSSSQLARLASALEQGAATYSTVDLEQQGPLLGLDPELGWLAWLPLRVAGADLGVLSGLAPGQPQLGNDQVEAATLFAQHVAALIDAAQALRREQRAAVTDLLSGLLNRRGFEERFREELNRAERARRELALVLVDCDDLKAINDESGHEAGDAVIERFGRVLRSVKRLEDVAARMGGDEFVLLLPECGRAAALEVAERVRRDLGRGARERPVSATFGVAAYPADGTTPAELLRAADRAMYRAKSAGKNRTFSIDTGAPVV
jgi:diguanylate cyclase (GGDEF)-like protein